MKYKPFILCKFSFQFVKSIGSSILPIKLQERQEQNVKVLKHVTGLSPIYVRTLEEINVGEEVIMNIIIIIINQNKYFN